MRSIATRSSSARMPDTIQTGTVAGQKVWFIWNETTEGENFAEKWNKDPRRAEAFFAWHARAVSDIERLADVEGIDQLRRMLGGALGSKPVGKALDEITDRVGVARRSGRLSVTPTGGLVVTAQSASTGVRANTLWREPRRHRGDLATRQESYDDTARKRDSELVRCGLLWDTYQPSPANRDGRGSTLRHLKVNSDLLNSSAMMTVKIIPNTA